MRLNITSMQASELIEHLKSYIAGGDCEVRIFDKINCRIYDIINTCTNGDHVFLHISSDKYTTKKSKYE